MHRTPRIVATCALVLYCFWRDQRLELRAASRLVIVGDRDTTAGVVESASLFSALPNGQFEVLPATPHPFQRAPMARLAASLREFFGAP